MERTLAIIKPDAFKTSKYIGNIISLMLHDDLQIDEMYTFKFTKELATEFYAEHKLRPTFDKLVTFMSSGPCIIVILKGPDAVKSHRNHMKTIRAMYATGLIENCIHGSSDSVENAEFEIKMISKNRTSIE